jgi:hypothetical protein
VVTQCKKAKSSEIAAMLYESLKLQAKETLLTLGVLKMDELYLIDAL